MAPWRTPLSDLCAIRFDGHAPSAAVARLAAAELSGNRVEIEREARRHPFENGDERLAVRLAGGEEAKHQRGFNSIYNAGCAGVVRTFRSAGRRADLLGPPKETP